MGSTSEYRSCSEKELVVKMESSRSEDGCSDVRFCNSTVIGTVLVGLNRLSSTEDMLQVLSSLFGGGVLGLKCNLHNKSTINKALFQLYYIQSTNLINE